MILYIIQPVLQKLTECGVKYEEKYTSVVINKCNNIKPVDITTEVHPGFPTDVQQPFTILLTQANGKSVITETIHNNRSKHVPYLNKMGTNIECKDKKIIIHGPTKLHGEEVYATDLRAGACLVVAGLIADGTTTIDNIYHILRGYEELPEKLSKVGANIKIVE